MIFMVLLDYSFRMVSPIRNSSRLHHVSEASTQPEVLRTGPVDELQGVGTVTGREFLAAPVRNLRNLRKRPSDLETKASPGFR
jgi:hypothetical protein